MIWSLYSDAWLDSSSSFEACSQTYDKDDFKKMFFHQSTQFYDHRNDERIVDQSSLDQTRLDSHDISKKA